MATLIIPNAVQIAVEAQCSGQPVVNVLHFSHQVGTFINVNDVLTAFKTSWEKANGPLQQKTSATTMVGYKLTDLSSANGATGYLASSAAGTGVTQLSTLASCALVKLGGGTRSRSGSGRIYHGPLSESQINADGRTIPTGVAATIATAYIQLRTDMEAVGLTLGVASRKTSSIAPAGTISVANIIATQRRRIR